MAAMTAAVLIVASPSACASGTGDHGGLTQLDDNGYLYFMDYKKDYYSPEVMDAMRKLGYIDPGCSAFFTHNTEGEPITCRNYDVLHCVSEEDPSPTGLNIVLHCRPEGKYESIALADAVWCGEDNPLLQRFGPDQEGFDPDWLDILPYQCMDGINEKGLYVSIQRVDIKEGEQPARFPVGSSMLLRFILDDCADVDEAVRKTKTGIMVPEDWQNCHFMVSDPSGRRYGRFLSQWLPSRRGCQDDRRRHDTGLSLRLRSWLSSLCDDSGAAGMLQGYDQRAILYCDAGIGCPGDSPKRGAEPLHGCFRCFHDTVQCDLQ